VAPSPLNTIPVACFRPPIYIYTPSFTAIQTPDFSCPKPQNATSPPPKSKEIAKAESSHPCRSPAVPRYLTGPFYTPQNSFPASIVNPSRFNCAQSPSTPESNIRLISILSLPLLRSGGMTGIPSILSGNGVQRNSLAAAVSTPFPLFRSGVICVRSGADCFLRFPLISTVTVDGSSKSVE
jgi:hypothetical protein